MWKDEPPRDGAQGAPGQARGARGARGGPAPPRRVSEDPGQGGWPAVRSLLHRPHQGAEPKTCREARWGQLVLTRSQRHCRVEPPEMARFLPLLT